MSKLYFGNLPSDINENIIRQLFIDNNLASTAILIKRGGYAFVDCADQTTADRAIDLLNGTKVFGSQIIVEPSVAGNTKKNGSETGESNSEDSNLFRIKTNPTKTKRIKFNLQSIAGQP